MSRNPDIARKNLERLLAPRHIACIGGNDAAISARQCGALFNGPVWGVNPGRSKLGGQPCFASVSDLPEPPDAVFLATPRSAALSVLEELDQAGAGGVACFTAGYGETGEDGKRAEAELVAAAGNLALVGPNSYGLINYVHNAMLWPFGAGTCECETGIALIMQSGMITADMAMNQRSVPLSYVISAGNQAILAVEDYIDVLVDNPRVTAFGLYIEGIINIERFAAAARRALDAGKPVVLLKAGSSSIGSRLAVSHTGSMAGSDESHQAFFDQLGILRVHSPELLLETLKFMAISGVPEGRRLAAFTCSGGEALMIADYCERSGLDLPQFSANSGARLASLLPDIATVSNPLDYTTPLWGNREVMPTVFDTALLDGFDAAIFIQDYPPEGFDADKTHYRSDAQSYIGAVNRAGIPAGICSELSENFDRESREMMVAGGVTPMQGFDRGLDAIELSCRYHEARERILADERTVAFRPVETALENVPDSNVRNLSEWEGKQLLCAAGLTIPHGRLLAGDDLDQCLHSAAEIGYPVVVKLVSPELIHKTELGAVAVNIPDNNALAEVIGRISDSIEQHNIRNVDGLLVEAMVTDVVHELLVGFRQDAQFGMVMVIGSGGIFVELYRDSTALLLPTSAGAVRHALSGLKCFPLLEGYRGKPGCNLEMLTEEILKLALFAESYSTNLVEMEVNPLMVSPEKAVVGDVLIRQMEMA